MADKLPGPGLCVFTTASFPTLAPYGGGTFQSVYTEAGPGPGEAVVSDTASRWQLGISGEQSADLVAFSVRGGFAGRRDDAARVILRREEDDAVTGLRGWCEPNLPVNWQVPASAWGAGSSWARTPCMAVLPNGKIVVTAPFEATATDGQTWIYDPRTETWTDGADWSAAGQPGLERSVASAYDAATGRLLLWSGSGDVGEVTTRAYASTDEGATWTLYSRGMYPVLVSNVEIRFAPDPGAGEWLGIIWDQQVVSSDHGVSWRTVGTLTGAGSAAAYIPLRTATGWLVLWIDETSFLPMVARIASASAPAENVAPLEFGDVETDDMVACTDADGIVYVVARGRAFNNERHILTLYRSLDGGSTWGKYLWSPTTSDDSTHYRLVDLVASCGQLHMLVTSAMSSGDTEGTWALVSLGGWSSVEAGSGASAAAGSDPLGRSAPGQYNGGATHVGKTWFPIDFPGSSGWATIASTGTLSLDSSGAYPGMRMVCIAGQEELYAYSPAVASLGFVNGEAIVFADAGPTLASITGTDIGWHLRPVLGNAGGTVRYRPVIDVCHDGIRVRDITAGTTLATASVDLSTSPTHIKWMLSPGKVSVWYRREGIDPISLWSEVCVDAAISTSGTTTDAGVQWGCASGAGCSLVVRMVSTAGGAEWLAGIDGNNDVGKTSADGLRGLRWGKAVPSASAGGYPVPDASDASEGEGLGYLAATGGPTGIGPASRVDLPVAYRYPVSAIDPEQSSSPRARWVADADETASFVFDEGDPVWRGAGLAIVALNATTRAVSLQLDNGAGGWETASVLDMALLPEWLYTLVGRSAICRTGSDVGERYIAQDELTGAWANVSAGGGTVFRRVVGNSGGYLTDDATRQQVVVTFAAEGEEGGVDGTEDVSGEGILYHHSAVRVVYPATQTPRRYARLVVANCDTDDGLGRPAAGILRLGRVIGFGAEADWTWTRSLEFSVTKTRRPDGTPVVRRDGPPRQVWSYPWTGGIALGKLRRTTANADSIVATGGVPLGTVEDAWLAWWGVIAGDLRSGEVPCVFFPALPSNDTTTTDPTMYVYGLLAADSISVTSVVGDEGIDEIVRMDSPTIEQIA